VRDPRFKSGDVVTVGADTRCIVTKREYHQEADDYSYELRTISSSRIYRCYIYRWEAELS